MRFYPLCPNLGKCPQFFHPAMLSTSDKARYVTLGVKTGAPDREGAHGWPQRWPGAVASRNPRPGVPSPCAWMTGSDVLPGQDPRQPSRLLGGSRGS